MRGSEFEYEGPTSLKKIEGRLLEIDHEKSTRSHNLLENFSDSTSDVIEGMEIGYLDIEKAKLELKRQSILDKRNNWLSRMIWNFIVPVVTAIITTYVTTFFITR